MLLSLKCFVQIQVYAISCSFLTHQHCNSVIEGHQTCQSQFALNEAMLPVTEHLCILDVFCWGFQEDLIHNLARHGSEADQLVVY